MKSDNVGINYLSKSDYYARRTAYDNRGGEREKINK